MTGFSGGSGGGCGRGGGRMREEATFVQGFGSSSINITIRRCRFGSWIAFMAPVIYYGEAVVAVVVSSS